MLSRRFEIQEIVAQDRFGVTFHALDTGTGEPVALRRFFPFGADGGGLFDEERSDYAAVVARLAGLRHPGLRAVLGGGCDPVDGMPFVATEWIDGESLAEMRQRATFTPAAAIAVIDRALEISEALSVVFGVDDLWVETDPALIIDDAGESRRGLTFAVVPMKWVGTEACQRNLLPLAELAEELLGWSGRKVPYQAGQGIGAWLKWLRANADILTLSQVRERLAGAAGTAPTEAQAARPRKSPTKEPWVLVAALAVLLAAAGWWLIRHPLAPGTRRLAAAAHASQQVAVAPDTAAAAVAPEPDVADPLPAVAGPPPLAEGEPGGVFRSGDTQRIMMAKDHEVTVEGVLKNIRVSDSGKTLYLEFVETTPQEEVRGCFITKNLPEDLSEQALRPLLGKRIRISGMVRIMHHFKVKWPEVLLKDRQSIQQVN